MGDSIYRNKETVFYHRPTNQMEDLEQAIAELERLARARQDGGTNVDGSTGSADVLSERVAAVRAELEAIKDSNA